MKNNEDLNYCGFGKSLWFHPPEWALFNASCRKHDQGYKEGGEDLDRLNADLGFLWRMLRDINTQSDYKMKKKAARTAIIYYILVRCFGWISFNFK